MAHDIAIDKVTNQPMMMYSGEKPWHGLGQYVGKDCVTWQKAVKAAHLDWEVTKQKLYGPPAKVNGKMMFRDIPAWGIFRVDTGQFISVVGEQYKPIQNASAFDWVDSLIGVTGGAHYETAGALGSGYRVWCLARIPNGDFVIGKVDQHQSYLLFTTSHDGSLSAQAKVTTVRVVCNNTLSMALSNEGQLLKIKHTKSADDKLARAKALMGEAINSTKQLNERLILLSKRALTREAVDTIFDRLFPKDKQKEEESTRRKNLIADVLNLYERNDKNAIPEIRGTAYNLLNAVTEYTDHHRTARITDNRSGYTQKQARSESSLFGSGANLKSKALEIILDVTQDASRPTRKSTFSIVSNSPNSVQ